MCLAQQPQQNPYPSREPYPSENAYFKQHPEVGGMAAEDNKVILNPFSSLKPEEKEAVRKNESYRLFMREKSIVPKIDITDEQRKAFAGTKYGKNEDALKQTLVARILTGDPSSLATSKQRAEALKIQKRARF